MDQFGEDPLTKLAFTIQANKGVYALLLGSGISRSSGIMTGWEITCDLVARYAAAQGIEDHFLEWYKKTYSQEEPNYSEIIGALGKTQQERQSIIEKYIEPSLEDLQQGLRIPTEAHKAIAKLVKDGFIKVVITTNFDRLLEKALSADEIGITPTVISSEEDLIQGQKPLEHSNCYIIKVHGDYKDAKIKNTKEELSKYSDEYNAILKRIFNNYGLIVCGWSAEYDTALIKAIRSATNRRYSLFWTSYNELKTNEEAKLLIDDREGIPIITNKIGGADGFFTKLQEKVEQIEKLSLRRPRTEALILSTLKDYLSEPEKNRIRIDDLFKEVLTTQLLEFKKFHKNKWITRNWEDKFSICEARTKILAKMVCIVGVYGTQRADEVDFICSIIQAICDKLRNTNNNGSYYHDNTNLAYPAYLLFTIYGITLTESKRWKELHQLLLYPLKRINTTGQSRLETACNPMWYYFGYDQFENDNKIHINGNNQDQVKVMFYQRSLIKEWINSIIFSNGQLDYSNNLFHFLCCLASIETKTDQEINSILEAEDLNPTLNLGGLVQLTKLRYLYVFINPKLKSELKNNILDNSFKQILKENGFRLIQNDKLLEQLFNNIKNYDG